MTYFPSGHLLRALALVCALAPPALADPFFPTTHPSRIPTDGSAAGFYISDSLGGTTFSTSPVWHYPGGAAQGFTAARGATYHVWITDASFKGLMEAVQSGYGKNVNYDIHLGFYNSSGWIAGSECGCKDPYGGCSVLALMHHASIEGQSAYTYRNYGVNHPLVMVCTVPSNASEVNAGIGPAFKIHGAPGRTIEYEYHVRGWVKCVSGCP